MHDDDLALSHQASGLLALARQRAARLIPVVFQGDETLELQLLWRLTSVLSDAGYPVTVLDGTSEENLHNPGLTHMLDHEYWPQANQHGGLGWSLVPARRGLQRVCEVDASPPALHALSELFGADSAVVVLAQAPTVARLLQGCDARPLVCAGVHKGALLSSYLAVKQLYAQAGLRPTLVAVQTDESAAGEVVLAGQRLRECAMLHLGLDLEVLELPVPLDASAAPAALVRLAMRMLESAPPLACAIPTVRTNARKSDTGIFARGH